MNSPFRVATICIITILIVSTTATPVSAEDEKPYFFINTASHYKYLGTNTTFADLAGIARKVGFKIEHGVHPQLTGGVLDEIDVYMLYEPNIPIVGENLVALRKWVRNGGILLACTVGRNALNGLMSEFGVEFGFVAISTNDLVLPAGSPLAGPNKIKKTWTRLLKVLEITDKTKSETILKYEDGRSAMTRTLKNTGKGEIIAIGCVWIFNNEGDSDRDDNPKLVENLLIYIKNKIKGDTATGDSYDLNLLNLKFKKGTTFVPGEEIKLIARIRNIGTQVAKTTRIAFYIEKTGPVPSAKVEIASATVNAIGAKKKIKIVKKAFLPDGLAAGTYEVTAVIDPDELTDDANTGNNGAAAKKKIVIQ